MRPAPDVDAIARRLVELGVLEAPQLRRPELLREALTHASAMTGLDNQRLEMLGDAVLGYLVADVLFEALPAAPEGVLTKTRASLVDKPYLAAKARELGVGAAMLLGKGEEQAGGRDRQALIADAYEAVLAAIYLSEGLDTARALILRTFDYRTATPQPADFKTQLQVKVQACFKLGPVYRVTGAEGAEHEPIFSVDVVVGPVVIGSGRGRTKRAAEQQAARDALDAWAAREPLVQAAIAPSARRE